MIFGNCDEKKYIVFIEISASHDDEDASYDQLKGSALEMINNHWQILISTFWTFPEVFFSYIFEQFIYQLLYPHVAPHEKWIDTHMKPP